MFRITLTPKAKQHTEEACKYYGRILSSLEERFLQTLERQYEKLKEHLQHYSFISSKKGIRSLAVPYFPFPIIFQIKENEVIIIDVHNTYQNPGNILNEP
jgi:hypothetical protein